MTAERGREDVARRAVVLLEPDRRPRPGSAARSRARSRGRRRASRRCSGRRRPPRSRCRAPRRTRSTRRNCAWFVSWYSSTSTCRKRPGVARRAPRRRSRGAAPRARSGRRSRPRPRARARSRTPRRRAPPGGRRRSARRRAKQVSGSTNAFFAPEMRARSSPGLTSSARRRPRCSACLSSDELVLAVEDRERRGNPARPRLAAQQPRAGGVERAHPQFLRATLVADQALDALPHLARRLVREREGEDLPRRHAALGDEPGDAPRQDARLARPGARDDEQRPVAVRDGGCWASLRSVMVSGTGLSRERGSVATGE